VRAASQFCRAWFLYPTRKTYIHTYIFINIHTYKTLVQLALWLLLLCCFCPGGRLALERCERPCRPPPPSLFHHDELACLFLFFFTRPPTTFAVGAPLLLLLLLVLLLLFLLLLVRAVVYACVRVCVAVPQKESGGDWGWPGGCCGAAWKGAGNGLWSMPSASWNGALGEGGGERPTAAGGALLLLLLL